MSEFENIKKHLKQVLLPQDFQEISDEESPKKILQKAKALALDASKSNTLESIQNFASKLTAAIKNLLALGNEEAAAMVDQLRQELRGIAKKEREKIDEYFTKVQLLSFDAIDRIRNYKSSVLTDDSLQHKLLEYTQKLAGYQKLITDYLVDSKNYLVAQDHYAEAQVQLTSTKKLADQQLQVVLVEVQSLAPKPRPTPMPTPALKKEPALESAWLLYQTKRQTALELQNKEYFALHVTHTQHLQQQQVPESQNQQQQLQHFHSHFLTPMEKTLREVFVYSCLAQMGLHSSDAQAAQLEPKLNEQFTKIWQAELPHLVDSFRCHVAKHGVDQLKEKLELEKQQIIAAEESLCKDNPDFVKQSAALGLFGEGKQLVLNQAHEYRSPTPADALRALSPYK